MKENEKETGDKDQFQEIKNDITQEEPEDSYPPSNRIDPPEPKNPNYVTSPEPTTEPSPKALSQDNTPRKVQESANNKNGEAPNNNFKDSSKDLQKNDFSTPQKRVINK